TSGGGQYCGTSTTGFLGILGYNGNSIVWESSTDGGLTWTATGTTGTNQGFANVTQTTCYRAIVTDAANPPDTSTVSCIDIFPATVGGTVSGGNTFCSGIGSGTLTLNGNVGNILNWQSSTDGGLNWTSIANTTNTLVYSGVTQNTLYEAVIKK